jgi:acyl-CoA thioesterase FadM
LNRKRTRPSGTSSLEDDGFRFVTPVDPQPADYDAQGHLNNAAIGRLFNDMRIAYIHRHLGEPWREFLRTEGIVVVAREVHVLYESEGLPSEQYVGAMRYVRREGRGAIIEQRIVEAATGRPVARAWVSQVLAHDGSVADWPDFYFARVAEVEGRVIEQRPSVRREWGPGS